MLLLWLGLTVFMRFGVVGFASESRLVQEKIFVDECDLTYVDHVSGTACMQYFCYVSVESGSVLWSVAYNCCQSVVREAAKF